MFRSDLKSANVFLSNKNMIKIGDLGVAKLLAATRYAHTHRPRALCRAAFCRCCRAKRPRVEEKRTSSLYMEKH